MKSMKIFYSILALLISTLLTSCGGSGGGGTTSSGGGGGGTVPTITAFTPARGSVGTTVTITGNNFSTNSAEILVKFNGTTAIVTSSSISQIVTTVPAGATTGPITITLGSQTATSSTNFTVTADVSSWHWLNPLPTGNTLSSVIYGGGKFVAVGDTGTIVASVDGVSWTIQNS